MGRDRWCFAIAAAAGAAGAAFGVALVVGTWRAAPYPLWVWVPTQAAGLSFVVCGTLLWLRRPCNNIGPLMTLLGTTWYIGDLQLVPSRAAFAVGFCLCYLHTAVLGHLALALPDGRLHHRYERRLVVALYGAPPVTQTVRLVAEYPPQPQGWGDPAGAYSVWAPIGSFAMLVLACPVIVLLVRRWTRAGRAVRRGYSPVWLNLLGLGVATAAANLAAVGHPGTTSAQVLAVVYAGGMMIMPVAVAGGLLRVSLARLQVAGLVVRLRTATSPEQLRSAVATALGDPEFDIWYRQPDGNGFVHVDGRPVQPIAGPGRQLTPIGSSRQQSDALLVHDAGLEFLTQWGDLGRFGVRDSMIVRCLWCETW